MAPPWCFARRFIARKPSGRPRGDREIIVPADDVVRDVEVVLANGGACATPANIVLSSDGVWPVPPDG
ncbi:MAG: hypothetical protein EDM73_07100 [Armatimonadetes bacterium]|nr:MAG: hypothetical protein EDM73_07100 [Armatimonadota bacterium]